MNLARSVRWRGNNMYDGALGVALQRQLLGHPYLHAVAVYVVLLLRGALAFVIGLQFGDFLRTLMARITARIEKRRAMSD